MNDVVIVVSDLRLYSVQVELEHGIQILFSLVKLSVGVPSFGAGKSSICSVLKVHVIDVVGRGVELSKLNAVVLLKEGVQLHFIVQRDN